MVVDVGDCFYWEIIKGLYSGSHQTDYNEADLISINVMVGGGGIPATTRTDLDFRWTLTSTFFQALPI